MPKYVFTFLLTDLLTKRLFSCQEYAVYLVENEKENLFLKEKKCEKRKSILLSDWACENA